jgi:hypothetical protein
MNKPLTQTDRLARWFMDRPDRLIPRWAVDRFCYGGSYRQEVSRCRQLGMRIEVERHRVPRLKRTVSFYVYRSPKAKAA